DTVTILAIFYQLRVDIKLYALVFGESALNDAVAIVLFRTIDSLAAPGKRFTTATFFAACGAFAGVLLGSCAIGAAIALVNALLCRVVSLRDLPMIETSA